MSDDISSIQSGDSCSYDESDSTHDLQSNGRDACPPIAAAKNCASDSRMDGHILTRDAPADKKADDGKREAKRRSNSQADDYQAGQFLKSMSKTQRDAWLDKQGYCMTRDGLLAPAKVSKQVWDTVGEEKTSSRDVEGGWRAADRTRGGRGDSRSEEDRLEVDHVKSEENNSNHGDAGHNIVPMGDYDDEFSDNEDFIRKFEQSKLAGPDGCRQEQPAQDYYNGSFNSSDLSESEVEAGTCKLREPEKKAKQLTDESTSSVRVSSKCGSAMASKINAPVSEFARADTNTPNTIINKRYAKLMSKMAGDGFTGLGDMEICTRHSRCESGDHATKPTAGDDTITMSRQGVDCEMGGWTMDGSGSQVCDGEISENRISEFFTDKGLRNSEGSSDADFDENAMRDSRDPKRLSQQMTKDGRDGERDRLRPKSKLVSSSRNQVQDAQDITSARGNCGQGLCTSETTDKAAKFEASDSDNLNRAYKVVADVAIENILGVARKHETLNTDFAKGSRVKTLGAQTHSRTETSLTQTGDSPAESETPNTDLAKGIQVKKVDIQTDPSTKPSLTPTEASLGDHVNPEDDLQRPQDLQMSSSVYEYLTISPEMEEHIGYEENTHRLQSNGLANYDQTVTVVKCEHQPVRMISNGNKSEEESLTEMKNSYREQPGSASEDDKNVTDGDGCSTQATFGNKEPPSNRPRGSCGLVKSSLHQPVDKSGLRVRFNIQESDDGDSAMPLYTAGSDVDNCSVGGLLSYQGEGYPFNKIKESTNPNPDLTKNSYGETLAQCCPPADATYLRAKSLSEASDDGKPHSDTCSMIALRKEISKQLVSRALKNTRGNRTILEMKKQERANYQKFEALKQSRLDEEKKQQLASAESTRQGPEYCVTGNKVNVEKKSKLYKPNIPHLTNPNHMPVLGGAKLVGGKAPVTRRTVHVKLPSINQATCAGEKTGSKNKEGGHAGDATTSKKSFTGSSAQSCFPENNEREVNKNTNKATSHDSHAPTPARDRIDAKQKVEVMTFENQHRSSAAAKSRGAPRDKNGSNAEPKKTTRLVLPKIAQSQNQKIHSSISQDNHSSEDEIASKMVGKIASTSAKKNKMDNPQAISQQSKGGQSHTKTDLAAKSKSCLPPINEKKAMKDTKASVEHSYRAILENGLSENSPLRSPAAPCKLPKVGKHGDSADTNVSAERGKVKGREKAPKQNPLQGNGRNKQIVVQTKDKGHDNNGKKPFASGAKKKGVSREGDKGKGTPQEVAREAAMVGDPVQSQFDQVQAEIDQQVGHALSSMKNKDTQQSGTKPLTKTQQLLIKAKTDFLDQLEEMDDSFLNDIVSDAGTAMYARDKKKPLIRISEPSSLDELTRRRAERESGNSSSAATTSKSDSEDDESEDDAEDDDNADDCAEDDGVDTPVYSAGGKHAKGSVDLSYTTLKSKALSNARSSVRRANDKISLSPGDEPLDYAMLNKSSNAVVAEPMSGEGMQKTYRSVENSEYDRTSSRQTDDEISQLFEAESNASANKKRQWGNSPQAPQDDADCLSYEEDVFLLDKMSCFHGTQGTYVLNEDFATSTEQSLHTGAHSFGRENSKFYVCHEISDRKQLNQNGSIHQPTGALYTPNTRLNMTNFVNDLGHDTVLNQFQPYAVEKKSRMLVHEDYYTTQNRSGADKVAGLTECCHERPNRFYKTRGTYIYGKNKRKKHLSTCVDANVNSEQCRHRLYLHNRLPECHESPQNFTPFAADDCGSVKDDAHPVWKSCLQGLSDSGFWEADQEQNMNFNNSKGGSEAEDDRAHSQCPSADDYSTRCDLERMHCWSTSMDTLLPNKDDATTAEGKGAQTNHKHIRRSRIPVRVHDARSRHWSGHVASFQCSSVPQNLVVVLKNKNGIKIGQAVAPVLFTEVDNRAASTSAQPVSKRRGNSANCFTVEIRGSAVQAAESGQESTEDEKTKPVSLAERIKKYQKNLPRNIHCGRGAKQNQWPEQPPKAPPGEMHTQQQVRNTSGQSSGKKILTKRPSMECTGQLDPHTNRNESTQDADPKRAEGADGTPLKEEPNLTPCIKSVKIHKNTPQPYSPNRNIASKPQTYPKKLSAGCARAHQHQAHEQHDPPSSPNDHPGPKKPTCLISQCELFTPESSPHSLNVRCAATSDKGELLTATTVVKSEDQSDEPKCDENILCEGHPDNYVKDTTLPTESQSVNDQCIPETAAQCLQARPPCRSQSAASPMSGPADGLANQFALEHPSVLAVDESLNLFLEYEKATSQTREHSPEQEPCNANRDCVTESKVNQRPEIPKERTGQDTERSNDGDKCEESFAKCNEMQTEDRESSRRSGADVSLAKQSEDDYQHNEMSPSRSSRGSTPNKPQSPGSDSSGSPVKDFLQLIYRKVEHLQNVSLAGEADHEQSESGCEQEDCGQDQGEHEIEGEYHEQELGEQEQRQHGQEHTHEEEHDLDEGHEYHELNDLDIIDRHTCESQRTYDSTVEQMNPSVTPYDADVTDSRRNQDFDSQDFEPKVTESDRSTPDVRYEQSPSGLSSHDSEIERHIGTHDLDVSVQSLQIPTPCSGGQERNEVKDQSPFNASSAAQQLNTPPTTGDSNLLGTPVNPVDVGENAKRLIGTSNSRGCLNLKTASPALNVFGNDTNVEAATQSKTSESNQAKRVKAQPVMKKSGIDLNPKAAAMSPTISKKSRKSRGVLFEKVNFTSAESESSEARLKELNNHNNSKIPFLQKSYSLGETRLPGGQAKVSLSSDDERGVSESKDVGELLSRQGDGILRNPDDKMGETDRGTGKGWSSTRKTFRHSRSDTQRSLSESKKSLIPIKSSNKTPGQESPVTAHEEHHVVPYNKTLGGDFFVKDCVLEYSMRTSSQGSELPPVQPRKGRLTMIFPTADSKSEGGHLESVQTSQNSVVDHTYSNDDEFCSSEESEHNTTFSVDEPSNPTHSLDPSIAPNSQGRSFTTNGGDLSVTGYCVEQAATEYGVDQQRRQSSITPITPINTFRTTSPAQAPKKTYKQAVNSHHSSIPPESQCRQSALPPLSTRQAGFPHRPKLKRYY